MTELNLGGVPDWPTCHRDDCDGIRVDAYHSCLAHLPEEALTTVLNVFCPGSDVDIRRTSISAELLERLLARLQGENGRPQLGTARFGRTRISGRAWFVGACFSSLADFDEAHFTGLARFDGARFEGEVRFSKAQFNGSTWFVDTRFNGPVQFGEAQFRMDVEFAGTWFGGIAYFGSAEFSRIARFSRAQFKATAQFNGARFIDEGRFIEAKFHEIADFAACGARKLGFAS